jgi:hypothetical protein
MHFHLNPRLFIVIRRQNVSKGEQFASKLTLNVMDTPRTFTLLCCLWLLAGMSFAQSDSLHVTFSEHGVQTISYQGQTLEDLNRWPADAFHIWHMKAFDSEGKPLSGGQYTWGESNNGRTFETATKTWRYAFPWGSIRLQYKQAGDTLNLIVTTTNNANSGITFDGASIYPLVLHLPRVPVGFGEPDDSHYIGDLEQPAIAVADFGAGEVLSVAPDPDKPVYVGFQALGKDFAYAPIVSSTAPDNYDSPEHPGRELKPGASDTFLVSLRFAPHKTSPEQLAPDAYKAFATRYPETLHWTDRRIIGTVFLASSPQGDKTQPSGFPTNPRRYFSDASVDIKTPEGLKHFQLRILKQASDVVENLKRMNAQAAITWDIEGEQYPQDTSYACSPDLIAKLSPEMESTITDKGSPYAGLKLDDAYFKIIHDAGFRVGVCVRPQRFSLSPDGTARQITLPDNEVSTNLIRKMKYAHDRWGATIFYLDSTVEADGKTLPAFLIEQAAAALPDSLLIPEESSPRMYRATAPFQTFLFHGDLSTKPEVRAIYPKAFSANLINDAAPAKLEENRTALTEAVRHGDILMLLSGYWQDDDPAAVQIYRDAALGSDPK